LEKYELDKASRPIADFVEDLSTWYLRRSRDRMRGDDLSDKKQALSTMKFVFQEFSKLLAPFMPFLAEDIYLKVKEGKSEESVHLEKWPKISKLKKDDQELLKNMQMVRKIVELGLSERALEGVRVRQPLAGASYEISDSGKLGGDYEKIIAEELNVKKVSAEKISGQTDSFDVKVLLDFNITPELKEEGEVREILRSIQDLRKKEKLNPKDRITLAIETDEKGRTLVLKYKTEISKTAGIENLIFNSGLSSEPVTVGGSEFKFKIQV
jgi:isoleucyl-tRNA synthetase